MTDNELLQELLKNFDQKHEQIRAAVIKDIPEGRNKNYYEGCFDMLIIVLRYFDTSVKLGEALPDKKYELLKSVASICNTLLERAEIIRIKAFGTGDKPKYIM